MVFVNWSQFGAIQTPILVIKVCTEDDLKLCVNDVTFRAVPPEYECAFVRLIVVIQPQ